MKKQKSNNLIKIITFFSIAFLATNCTAVNPNSEETTNTTNDLYRSNEEVHKIQDQENILINDRNYKYYNPNKRP